VAAAVLLPSAELLPPPPLLPPPLPPLPPPPLLLFMRWHWLKMLWCLARRFCKATRQLLQGKHSNAK